MKNFLIVSGVFAFAFAVLFVSIFNSSAITYSLSQSSQETSCNQPVSRINYPLPFMGNILSDSPLWGFKALRDKIWFDITPSHLRKAQLALLFADKRLAMSQKLFENGEADSAMSTFTKGEKYLPIAVSEEEIARSQGIDTSEFLEKLAMASLKHREIAEYLIKLAPENARPLIVEMERYPNSTFESARNALNSKGLPVPKNPFNGS